MKMFVRGEKKHEFLYLRKEKQNCKQLDSLNILLKKSNELLELFAYAKKGEKAGS